MIFLSLGYFSSRNCLREVVATMEKEKPNLFVHEADPSKGGAPLGTLSLDLPNVTHRNAI